jgi:hypothetical protein
MPAKDSFHNIVKNALVKDGWKITHDPFTYEEWSRIAYCILPLRRMSMMVFSLRR